HRFRLCAEMGLKETTPSAQFDCRFPSPPRFIPAFPLGWSVRARFERAITGRAASSISPCDEGLAVHTTGHHGSGARAPPDPGIDRSVQRGASVRLGGVPADCGRSRHAGRDQEGAGSHADTAADAARFLATVEAGNAYSVTFARTA